MLIAILGTLAFWLVLFEILGRRKRHQFRLGTPSQLVAALDVLRERGETDATLTIRFEEGSPLLEVRKSFDRSRGIRFYCDIPAATSDAASIRRHLESVGLRVRESSGPTVSILIEDDVQALRRVVELSAEALNTTPYPDAMGEFSKVLPVRVPWLTGVSR